MGFLGSFGDFVGSMFSDGGDAISDVVSTVGEGVSDFVQSAADPSEGLPFVAAFAAAPFAAASLGASAAMPASQSLMAATLPSAYATTVSAAVPAATTGASIWDSIVTGAEDAWGWISGSSTPASSQYALGTPNLASSSSALPNLGGAAQTSQYALSGSLPNVGAGAGGFWESITRTAGDAWSYGGDIVKKLTGSGGSVKPIAAAGAKKSAAAIPEQTGIAAAVGQSGMMLPLLLLGALAIFWLVKK